MAKTLCDIDRFCWFYLGLLLFLPHRAFSAQLPKFTQGMLNYFEEG